MSENLEDIKVRFQRWKSALEGKGLKVHIGKTKMMVSGCTCNRSCNRKKATKKKINAIDGERLASG